MSTGFSQLSIATVPLVGSIDGHNWSYWAFVGLGLGSLLPFNLFITADPYTLYKLSDLLVNNTSLLLFELPYENAAISGAAVSYLFTTLCITFFFLPYIHKYRIYTSFIGIILCLFICFLFTFVNVQQWPTVFFVIIMILVIIQSILGAILLNSLLSLVSTLPSRYIQGSSIVMPLHKYIRCSRKRNNIY
jgi:hypothetical protein